MLIILNILIICTASQVHSSPQQHARESISHTDIRDAIVSLLSVLRDQVSKLERHEYRERNLGDLLTRSLTNLDKKTRGQEKVLESLIAQLTKGDERLQRIEQILLKKEERDDNGDIDIITAIKSLEQKMAPFQSIAVAGDSMTRLVGELRNKVDQLDESYKSRLTHMNNEVKVVGERSEQQLSRIEELLSSIVSGNNNMEHSDAERLRAAAVNLSSMESKWEKNIQTTETAVFNFQIGLALLSQEIKKLQTNTGVIKPTETIENMKAEHSHSDEHIVDLLNAILDSLESIQLKVDSKRSSGLGGIERQLNVTIDELRTFGNDTLYGLKRISHEVTVNRDSASEEFKHHVNSLKTELIYGQVNLQNKLEEVLVETDQVQQNINESHVELSKEFQSLNNVERVLLHTADGVLDTKRRIEYGIQQILLEVGDLIKFQSKSLNSTIQSRFDRLTTLVIQNQTSTLRNLTSQMEREISQVWRQIGIMYQQLSSSANVLDKIHSQTENYVNDSRKTMDSMEGKVGMITHRMTDVDDNLNYLLGRLSLVTQEFNMIKTGIGEALVNLRESFKEIGDEIERKELATDASPTETMLEDELSLSKSSVQ